MVKKVITTINGTYPGTKLKGADRYNKLYHYTSFDSFVKIWLTQQLKFGIVENVNDIQEAEISCNVNNFQQMPLMFSYSKIKKDYKQISLTMDYDSYFKGCMSPMMWGHYADKRKGICIEIDFNKIIFPEGCLAREVKYISALSKYFTLDSRIKNEEQLRKFVKRKSKDVFFTKLLGWKGENEFRIVCDTSEFLNIENAITAVYLTSCDSLECELVEKLVGRSIPVKYLKYISAYGNLSLPVVVDTYNSRVANLKAKNNPDNALNPMFQQAGKIYESAKGDQQVSLLQEYIYFDKK